MQRKAFFILLALMGWLLLHMASAQSAITAEAIQRANLRASPGTDAEQVGEINRGTLYPVIGRSEFFPWVLLASPQTQQPIGWVFQELVTLRGDLNSVPLSTVVVSAAAVAPAAGTAAPPVAGSPGPTATLPAPIQPASGVVGTAKGEINIRYGPGSDYPRLGVATAGQAFEVVGYHTQFPWVQVRYPDGPGAVGWIALNLLDITGDIFSLTPISLTNLGLPTLTPTPSVINAGTRPGAENSPLSPAFADLGNQLWLLMLRAGFDLETNRFGALFVMDLQTKEAFSFGSDIAFSGTSVNKVAILARLYGTLVAPPDAQIATSIANTMICSNNTSTNDLLNVIGQGDEWRGSQEVSRFLNQLGLTHSFLTSPFLEDPTRPLVPPYPIAVPITGVNQSKANPDLSNQLTVDETGYLLEDIYECAYEDSGPLLADFGGAYEPRECRQMLHVMSNNNVDGLLRAGVPAETRVAHKHGWIADTHSNAAVFFTPGGNYIIVAMMFQPDWLNFQESLPVMAEISRTVYNFYNPAAPMPAIREGFIPEAPTCNFAGTPLIADLRQAVWDQ
ncbi:MAG: SH3 domain-containing protein [Anaerolineae bacterium]|jgi:uncharacterized protein YraI|nr:SH3 domain-containing protein [Anaerolineae bacterium]